jgi:hypothetical protein
MQSQALMTMPLRSAALCTVLTLSSPTWAQTQAPQPAAHDAHATHAWEASLAFGRDFDTDENLWALALGRRFGDGWKGVLEFADGKHGSHGSYVTSVKAMKELGRWDAWEFGLGAGGAYVKEDHHSGWGLLVAAELAYAINAQWGLKLEASYLWGLGEIDSVRAPAVQAGVVFKF